MTTIEHLNKIKSKCENFVSIYDNAEPHTPLPAVAGWRSTIAAINEIFSYNFSNEALSKPQIVKSILSAWPEELLN